MRQFAEAIAGSKEAAARLKGYYSLNDTDQWQREVEAGTRMPPGTAPLTVCGFLFPKSKITKRPIEVLPTADELQRRREIQRQELLAKEGALNA